MAEILIEDWLAYEEDLLIDRFKSSGNIAENCLGEDDSKNLDIAWEMLKNKELLSDNRLKSKCLEYMEAYFDNTLEMKENTGISVSLSDDKEFTISKVNYTQFTGNTNVGIIVGQNSFIFKKQTVFQEENNYIKTSLSRYEIVESGEKTEVKRSDIMIERLNDGIAEVIGYIELTDGGIDLKPKSIIGSNLNLSEMNESEIMKYAYLSLDTLPNLANMDLSGLDM